MTEIDKKLLKKAMAGDAHAQCKLRPYVLFG